MVSQKKATCFGLAAVLCWSTVATAFKLSLVHLSPIQLILVASLASWLFLVGVLLVRGQFSELFSQTPTDYLVSFGFGLLNPTLYYLLLFFAYDQLPAQEAQAINYSWAIVMTIMAVPLLGQKLHWFDLVAAGLCYFGVLVIATRGDLVGLEFAHFSGVLYAVLSTLIWSLYWILNQKKQRDPVIGLSLNFSFALPVIIFIALAQGELQSLLTSPPAQGLWWGVYVGVFEMGLAFVLWLQAMKLAVNTARIANLIFISPFLSLIFIAVFLGEEILSSTLLGLALIVIGLGFQQKYSTLVNSA